MRRTTGRARQWVATQCRPDRVRLDLGARHSVAATRRCSVEVLLARRRVSDDDDLSAKHARRHVASQHLPERHTRECAGTPSEVDQRASAGEQRSREALAVHALGGHDGKALEARDRIGKARHHPSVRGREVGGRSLRTDLRQIGVASEDIGVAARVHQAGRERHAAGVADGVVERRGPRPRRRSAR